MINIIIAQQYQNFVSENFIEKIVTQTLTNQKIDLDVHDLSVVIDTDEVLKDLNQQYRDIDSPTDVLSFTSNDIDPETNHTNLGDIVISFPRAECQAAEANHSIEKEIQLLTIHGVLHLLGYDHSTDEEKASMWQIQDELMSFNLKDK